MGEIAKKKRRGWRWFAWAGVALVMLVILAFVIWMKIEESALHREVDALRLAGEPVVPDDFVPRIPDGPDNAAHDLRAAIALLNDETDAAHAYDTIVLGLPLRDDERELFPRLLAESQPALSQVEIAMTKPRCEWAYHLRSPVMLMLFPELSGLRTITYRLMGFALLDHDRGDDASALRRVQQIRFIARSLKTHPSFVGNLVGRGCHIAASSTLLRLAPDMRIGSNDKGSAAPADVRPLIDELLDDRAARDDFRVGIRAERMELYDAVQSFPGQATTSSSPAAAPIASAFRILMRPHMAANAVAVLNHVTVVASVVDAPNRSAARARIPAGGPQKFSVTATRPIPMPDLSRTVDLHYCFRTDQHFAAIALAMRWYAVEHDGQLPDRLDDLVPKYLPFVPLDPMSPNDTPIRFSNSDGDDPILYSVGFDGVDNGGSEKGVLKSKMQTEFGDWEREDRVEHLKRQPRPPQPPANVGPGYITVPR